MDEFINAFSAARMLNAEQIACSLLMSFVLCSVLSFIYRVTFQGLSYSRAFIHTMILGGMVVAMMIMAIGNNLARGLGILGTLAIVRFRTPIRDSRDMMFLFVCLGVGIACGAGTYGVAIIGTIMISAAALLLNYSPYASRRSYEGLLTFVVPSDSGNDRTISDTMELCCASFHMIAMREAVQGDAVEYSYQVRLLDPSYQQELIEKLTTVEGLENAQLLMQRTTVEL
ncbi:MAG: DUF4956 domain-containing protein [Verrucomicrobia bacterium]|jgi:uncharacterized membrane protein YhiD involved in acid resistance|nr:DUF4956 domain-containing protein [Verrucomicrobiota bacterium]MBT7068698.1 DUF4956 domain-containing protein [Verrucomicrobiota bacterium]MBT7701847.1 DUF4956 domain-containing protein [Verrucomicrobiota bacterium]